MPKKVVKRSDVIHLRIHTEQKRVLKKAAKQIGLSEYIRNAAMKQAESDLMI
jgi:uncharacterized protein (DUF1778 family)